VTQRDAADKMHIHISVVQGTGGGSPSLGDTAGWYGQKEMDKGPAVFSGTPGPDIIRVPGLYESRGQQPHAPETLGWWGCPSTAPSPDGTLPCSREKNDHLHPKELLLQHPRPLTSKRMPNSWHLSS